MPGATLTTQLGLEAATASGTGQRDFWSTESSFTSAPEQLHEQGASCHCLCSCGLCSPVLRAPQRSSSHSILEHSHSSARLAPFQICHVSGLGGNVLPPATTSHYREHIQHLSCSSAWAHSSQPDTSNSCTLGNSRQEKNPYTSSSSLAEVTSTTCSDTQRDASAGGVSPEHSLGLGLGLPL